MSETTMTDLAELGAATAEAPVWQNQKLIHSVAHMRTGRRKEAVARVWVKPGTGTITVNGKDVSQYFARPGCA